MEVHLATPNSETTSFPERISEPLERNLACVDFNATRLGHSLEMKNPQDLLKLVLVVPFFTEKVQQ